MFSKPANFLLDLLFPLFCVSCGSYGTVLCSSCLSRVPPHEPAFMKRPSQHLSFVLIATRYDHPTVKAMVTGLKYGGITLLARPMGYVLADALKNCVVPSSVLAPIPLHWRKQALRGFNQSELLAQALAAHIDAPIDRGLRRIRYTPSQSKLARVKRLANVRNAFRYTGEKAPRSVLLVDDITTTYATLDDAARGYRAAGSRVVGALVFARNQN